MGKIRVMILKTDYHVPECFESDTNLYEIDGQVPILTRNDPQLIDEEAFSRAIDTFLNKQRSPIFGYLVRCLGTMGVVDREWGDPTLIFISVTGQYKASINLPSVISRQFLKRRFAANKQGYQCLCGVFADGVSPSDAQQLYNSGVDIVIDSRFDTSRLDRELRERHCLVARLWEWHVRGILRDIATAIVAFVLFGIFQSLGVKLIDVIFLQLKPWSGIAVVAILAGLFVIAWRGTR